MVEKLPTGASTNSVPVDIGRTAAEGDRAGRQANDEFKRQLNDQFGRQLPGTGRTPLPQYPDPHPHRQGGL
jgi:hypothetical protein